MGGVALAELTAAVTNAGGIGCVGAATFFLQLDLYRLELQRVKQLTKGPWGVDILASDLTPDMLSTMVDILIEEGASMFVTGRGTSKEMVARCRRAGVKVGCVAGQVRHAVSCTVRGGFVGRAASVGPAPHQAVQYGYDFVVVQGQEGGGHTGDVSLMPLLPQVIDAVGRDVPVIAAGGIYDGRGLAAALAMGADGVWVGTRFLASHEARTVPGYKERMLQTTSRDTQITTAYTGKPCRVIRNKWLENLPSRLQGGQLTEKDFYDTVESEEYLKINHIMGVEFNTTPVDLDIEFMPCGQVVGAIRTIEPAHKIVNDMVLGAKAQLDRMNRARL